MDKRRKEIVATWSSKSSATGRSCSSISGFGQVRLLDSTSETRPRRERVNPSRQTEQKAVEPECITISKQLAQESK
jgi:hypothetical protein